MKTLATPTARANPFPETEIREKVEAWWKEKNDARDDDPFAEKRKDTLYQVLPVIDSLEVVRFTLVIEQILDKKIPPKFIKRGGYETSEEMLKHLMPQLRKLYENQKN